MSSDADDRGRYLAEMLKTAFAGEPAAVTAARVERFLAARLRAADVAGQVAAVFDRAGFRMSLAHLSNMSRRPGREPEYVQNSQSSKENAA